MSAAAWPEGVIARYLTVGGASVDVTQHSDDETTQALCGGCGKYDTTEWSQGSAGSRWADREAGDWAQDHAEKCRALPKPGAVR